MPQCKSPWGQCILFDSTVFLFYINDLPNNILTSWINIYAYISTFCGCTFKNLEGESLALGLASELGLTSRWGKDCFVLFCNSKINVVIIRSFFTTVLDRCSLIDVHHLSDSSQTSSSINLFVSFLKVLEVWRNSCKSSKIVSLLLPCSLYIRIMLNQKGNIPALHGLEFPLLPFPALAGLKNFYTLSYVINYFPS